MPLLFSVLYVILCGILSHIIGEAVPRRIFHADRFPFSPWKWERNGKIYDRLHIRSWKDRVPDMSRVMKKMVPKRFETFPTVERVDRLIAETCVAETTHVALCLLAPVIRVFWRRWVGTLLSAIVILCNIPFILIQRYNRPDLIALRGRLAAREERRRNANSDPVG